MPESSFQHNNEVLLHVEAEPRTGSCNMATDEHLLEAALAEGWKAVRMYRWIEPTVSLGYFQNSDAEVLRTKFKNIAAVRRLSGGGAILHHHELTYSLVLPSNDSLAQIPTELYGRVHSAIIKVLGDFGAGCAMRGEDNAQADEPFLCFVRGDRHDIHCAGQKVAGSAQRRRKGAVLQHGSIILERSTHASAIPGLRDLAEAFQINTTKSAQIDDLEIKLGKAIAASLGPVRGISNWPADAASRVTELQAAHYDSIGRCHKSG